MTTQIKLLAASLVALALVGGGYLLGSYVMTKRI